jgi:hypothetical protein
MAPVVGVETGRDDRQAGRHQQRPGDALEGPGGDEEPHTGREPAQHRGGDETGQTDHEHPPPAVPVAGAAPEQEEGRQRDQVAVEHPLQAPHRGVKIPADGRQGDVDDRPVEEHHPRAEHGGQDHPPSLSGPVAQGRCIAHASDPFR